MYSKIENYVLCDGLSEEDKIMAGREVESEVSSTFPPSAREQTDERAGLSEEVGLGMVRGWVVRWWVNPHPVILGVGGFPSRPGPRREVGLMMVITRSSTLWLGRAKRDHGN